MRRRKRTRFRSRLDLVRALRRGEYGEAIHGLLGPVDELLSDLVKRGQDSEVFAQHLHSSGGITPLMRGSLTLSARTLKSARR